MPELRIENDALKREARFRTLSWGTVLLLVAVATFLLVLRASGYIGDSSDLGSPFVVTIVSTAINVAPDGSPLFTRDTGYQEIYALKIRWP